MATEKLSHIRTTATFSQSLTTSSTHQHYLTVKHALHGRYRWFLEMTIASLWYWSKLTTLCLTPGRRRWCCCRLSLTTCQLLSIFWIWHMYRRGSDFGTTSEGWWYFRLGRWCNSFRKRITIRYTGELYTAYGVKTNYETRVLFMFHQERYRQQDTKNKCFHYKLHHILFTYVSWCWLFFVFCISIYMYIVCTVRMFYRTNFCF